MEFNDILGLGKVLPLDKLIVVMQKGIGRITKSHFDRKDADAKAYEIKKLAEAKADEIRVISAAIAESSDSYGQVAYTDKAVSITANGGPGLLSLEERKNSRLSFQENKRQLNIENVASYAAEDLKQEPFVTDQPVDEDWISRFFNIAGNVSDEDMQAIWGRVLAGEIKQPKSFSLRTLDVIRNLSKKEAELFLKIANFALTQNGSKYFLFKSKMDFKAGMDANPQYKFSFDELSLLTEIGLLLPGDLLTKEYRAVHESLKIPFIAGDKVVLVEMTPESAAISLEADLFTQTGNELLRLAKKNPPMDYLTAFAKSFASAGTTVRYSKLIGLENNVLHYEDEMQSFEDGGREDI